MLMTCPLLGSDQKTLTSEIEKVQEGLKPKVRELQRMEGGSLIIKEWRYFYEFISLLSPGHVESKGFELKGMNIEKELIADN